MQRGKGLLMGGKGLLLGGKGVTKFIRSGGCVFYNRQSWGGKSVSFLARGSGYKKHCPDLCRCSRQGPDGQPDFFEVI